MAVRAPWQPGQERSRNEALDVSVFTNEDHRCGRRFALHWGLLWQAQTNARSAPASAGKRMDPLGMNLPRLSDDPHMIRVCLRRPRATRRRRHPPRRAGECQARPAPPLSPGRPQNRNCQWPGQGGGKCGKRCVKDLDPPGKQHCKTISAPDSANAPARGRLCVPNRKRRARNRSTVRKKFSELRSFRTDASMCDHDRRALVKPYPST